MAAGPAEKLKTRIVKSLKQARGEQTVQIRARKENGRLRVCANGHYRIDAATPPNPAAKTRRREAPVASRLLVG
jgi:hypothetical protein